MTDLGVMTDSVKYMIPLVEGGKYMEGFKELFKDGIPEDIQKYYIGGGTYQDQEGRETYVAKELSKDRISWLL